MGLFSVYMEEIKNHSDEFDKLSDIELVVIVAKRIDRCLDTYFSPSDRPKRAMLGRKLSMSTLDRRLKNIISKNILYQRNDLVHTPEVNEFCTPEARATFVKLSEEIFREFERLAQSDDHETETDGPAIEQTRSAESQQSLDILESLSEELITCSPSLVEIISDDLEKLLGDM